MIDPTTGCTSSGWASTKAPTAAKRSASQPPSYSSAPAAKNAVRSMGVVSNPAAVRSNASRVAAGSELSTASSGTPMRTDSRGQRGDEGDSTSSAVRACATEVVNTDGQSIDRHAGTMPSIGRSPGVGFNPTMPLHAAGTRPDPAVSVPRENVAIPAATATAEPELEP